MYDSFIDAILISSPIIGGVFSRPAIRWPSTLGKLAYLRDHPYFLPCFIPSVIAFVAFLGALVGLKEVFMFVSFFFAFLRLRTDLTFGHIATETKEVALQINVVYKPP